MRPFSRALPLILLVFGTVAVAGVDAPAAVRAGHADGHGRCTEAEAPTGRGRLALRLGSRRCLGCHDGTVAPNVLGGAEGIRTTGGLGKHPVGVSYREAYERRRGRMRPPGLLDRRLVLPGGKVECESCHSPDATDPAMLVMSNAGDRLCLSCHGK